LLSARLLRDALPVHEHNETDDALTRGRHMVEANGLGKLLDIELEANIRFGAREMSLAELLEIGPGAVIPLDRQVTDPVDLIIGDKVVARGEVVLVQGKFGLRITEVVSG
jgi:flagellar motor switch protein FliN/FliY